MPTETSVLKPCPLCGGAAEIWRAHPENPRRPAWIACMDKCLVLTREFATTEEAITHWNRRHDRVEGWMEAVRWLQRRAKFDAGPWMAMSAPDAIQDAAREMESIDAR